MRNLVYLAIFIFIPFYASAQARKTVCSMTLNSPHEAEMFKRYLPKDQFNFVELVDADSEDWLANSCAKGVSCDMLIISGHFGGSFFGESEAELPLETLEQASCNRSCDGIIKKPKEVFLFGCNTLAGKEKDRRTPEQYRQVLIADGFSAEQASNITAFRYSPFGSTFSDRMRRVFSNSPQIYGFSSIAPAGENIEDMLKDYLSKKGKTYFERLVSYSQSNNPTAENKSLAKSLKDTNFVQTSGESKYSLPICYLNSNAVLSKDKTLWIQRSLESDDLLTVLPDIALFLEPLLSHPPEERTPDENAIIQSLTISASQKEKLLSFLEVKEYAFLSTQVSILNLMHSLSWVSSEYHLANLKLLVLGDLSVWDYQKYDLIRSNKITIPNLSFDEIPASAWSSSDFLMALQVLKPKDVRFQNKLFEAAKDPKVTYTSRPGKAAGKALVALQPLQDNIILKSVAMLGSHDKRVRYNFEEILRGITSASGQVLDHLYKTSKSNSIPENIFAIEALGYLGSKNIHVHRHLIDLFFQSDLEIQKEISLAIANLDPQDLETQELVADLMLNSNDADVLYNLKNYLRDTKSLSSKILSAFEKLLLSPESSNRVFVLQLLVDHQYKSEQVLERIIVAILSKDIPKNNYHIMSTEIAAYIDLFPSMIVKLLSDFSDQIGSTKTTILQTVSEMKTESPLIREIIRSAFIDLDFEVRLAANDAAFAKYPNDVSFQVLIAASLNDKDQSVQRRSKHYLGQLKPTDANVLKIIRDSARSGNVIAQELLKKLELNN